MKKIAVFLMLVVVTLCCAFAFTACGSDGKLAMDKRYIFSSEVKKDAAEQSSFVFHSNGTGEYTLHDDYSHAHYVIHFKYTYADSDKSAVVCFYDSITTLDGDDGSYTSTNWSRLVTISKNVLVTGASTFWINEDYLKTIPNYSK
ncbi:MAG: hypothetical protein J1F61_05175 [Clostridiales bacterium]|nr:hypothetical protein [Clostridiales bacterium]